MKASKNVLTEHEKELVSLLMQDCQSTGEIQAKLKRLFAGTIERMLESEMDEHLGYCISYSKNHHSDIIKITHPQNEDRLNSRFVLGVGDFSIILGG